MSEKAFDGFVKAWRDDPAWRARAEADPKAALAEKGVVMPGVDEVRIAVDTPDTVHMVFPPAPNASLTDSALENVVGASAPAGWTTVTNDDGSVDMYYYGSYARTVYSDGTSSI